MFGGRFEVPLLIRMVIGRSWGQGAQHSQSLQSLFAHIPGLTVVMPASSQSILETYPFVIANHRGPGHLTGTSVDVRLGISSG